MPRIYRYDDAIRLPQPSAADFAKEWMFAREALGDLLEEEKISGAFMYGSALTDPRPGSDIDIMISTSTITPELMLGVRTMTQTIHERSGIPVDIACFSEHDLSTARHRFYHEHLLAWFEMLAARHPENIIGRNPVDITKPLQSDLLTDIDDVLSEYLHLFRAAFMEGHYPKPEATLEYILDFPHKGGRHAIGALVVRKCIPANSLDNTKKFSIAAAVQKVFGTLDSNIYQAYDKVASGSILYSEFAGKTHHGGIGRKEYDNYVYGLIDATLPDAILLAEKLQNAYRSLASI